jgi:hypothetical protein
LYEGEKYELQLRQKPVLWSAARPVELLAENDKRLPLIERQIISYHSSAAQQGGKDYFRELILPLPVDQRLFVLVQYNVLRAITTNMNILSLHSLMSEKCVQEHGCLQLFPTSTTIPESLVATSLQQSTPHEGWIDLLPSPRMRDNSIRLAGMYDKHTLLMDVVGAVCEEYCEYQVENSGMLAWTDPWHASGWELTPGFIKKWKFLLEGCQEMIEATNRWRAIRNEDPLVIEL